ncbi:MAG: hypothetical protein GOVbin7759_51 [Prokaryotic dsDNA virus sp.]|jgi:putative FmdB family regulatory protein|nr:MAG: hypothetical protein GOVbin7759_51 [Prokaryotic dsDNA virus sp.]|tara:strand:+ start:641 stop:1030 length:390 start_codon:yes stop_codon:yes gene_type:complete
MPLYDFRCDNEHRFERFVSLSNYGNPQSCECGAPASRVPCAPTVISDAIPPTRGADGKIHESRASLNFSLTPEGNPKGERYHQLGSDEQLPAFKAPEFDEGKRRDDIRKSLADIKAGRTPPAPVTGIPA